MVNFEEHFWGDKYNGFDVLQHNFKLGLNSSKEFTDFLKERTSIEEAYSKNLLKLATKCSTVNSSIGTFEPCWRFLQSSTEKLANVHLQVIHHLSEVSKTVRDYGDQQKEKQKQMKDSFSTTSDAVLNLQNLGVALLKAKELYQTRCQEVEKCRKDFSNLKDIKNAEIKFKKATEEYKQLVEKRENARKEYHEKMTEIAQSLQKIEENHLTQMSEILSKYGESIKVERFLLDQIIDEFGRNMVALTVENLLQQFISTKQTGKELPATVEFEQVEMNSMPVDIDAIAQAIKEEKKNKKKERKTRIPGRRKKKDKVNANGSLEKTDEAVVDPQNELQLDEEGYVIRPVDDESVYSSRSKMSDSSDDSDSDSDDENHRIQVRIKPVEESRGSSSDLTEDQLKKLSATLTLMSPSALTVKSGKDIDKKFVATWGSHSSLNKLSAKSRSNNDLLSLDKNSDTASLHSLPVNSSIPALEKTLSTENNMDDILSASSPLASPTFDNFVGSFSVSPSGSFDQSVETLPITITAVKTKTADDAPPPLPAKIRSFSLENQDDNNSDNNISNNERTFDAFTSHPVHDNKSTSLPAASKSTSSLEALRPPPSEKKLSTVLPPPFLSTSRGLRANSTSLPRPKPGQLVAPPSTVTSTRRNMQTSVSAGNIASQQDATNVANTQSSVADLLDINFSLTNVPVLSPEKENTTSHWVKPDSEIDDTSDPPQFSPSIVVPPILPRRSTPPSAALLSSPSTTTSPPLAAGVVDRAIPIAVAFIETVNGVFKGSDEKSCIIKVTGDMTISFPANIVAMFLTNQSPPMLSFLVTGTSSLEQIFPNKALVERGGQLPGGEGMTFKFNMAALTAYLRKQAEVGAKASYYNIDILKYQVRCNGMSSAPLQLSAYWRCDNEQTDLKIDYKYNDACMSTPVTLNNVSVVVPVDGGVTIMQSKPTAIWSSEHQRCMWKLAAISSVDSDVQALRARFEITRGPSTPVPIAVQYTGEGSTISLLNFDLKSPSYKLSLVKKRFASVLVAPGDFYIEEHDFDCTEGYVKLILYVAEQKMKRYQDTL